MPVESRDAPKVPAAIERFVKQLVVTLKAVVLYPPASSIPKENAVIAAEMLQAILQDRSEVRFSVQKKGLSYEGVPVFEGRPAYESFAQELYNRGLADVRFHSGLSAEAIVGFLGVLKMMPAEVAAAGGFATRLWDLGVDSVTVKEASARIVESSGLSESSPESGEAWPPDLDRTAEIIAAAHEGRPRDQRLLVRLLGDEEALSAYLRESMSTRGRDPAAVLEELRLAELARGVSYADREQRTALYRALASAIMGLESESRRAILAEKLLPEARGDEAVASVIRQMDIDEVCRTLVEGMTDDPTSVDGLARALRNLALISLADREEVMNAAGAAMRSADVPEETIAAIFETVSPSQLRVRDQARTSEVEEPVESILKLVDLAPGSVARRFEEDSGFAALQEESRVGITDGDVVGALVTLVSVDAKGANFSSMMSLLENNVGLLIERGEYEVAADAADALAAAIADPDVPVERSRRIEAALVRLARNDELVAVAKAIRMFDSDSPEHQACERLLNSLGDRAIEPLLEILANEPDMTARKSLVDLMSGTARRHVDALGSHVSDSRWYFVRNVVAILGRAKSSDTLPYLGRTLRHNDARVRRETIRAIVGVPDRLATEMLVAALDDADAQNVQLAARYLGSARIRGAEAALAMVARGEGRGNRETGPRAEAIEALGRMGAESALPTLEQISTQRRIIGAAKARELRAAADQAIAAIRARSASGEVDR